MLLHPFPHHCLLQEWILVMMEQWDNVLLHSLFMDLRFKEGTMVSQGPRKCCLPLDGGWRGCPAEWQGGIGMGCEVLLAWSCASLPESQPVLENQAVFCVPCSLVTSLLTHTSQTSHLSYLCSEMTSSVWCKRRMQSPVDGVLVPLKIGAWDPRQGRPAPFRADPVALTSGIFFQSKPWRVWGFFFLLFNREIWFFLAVQLVMWLFYIRPKGSKVQWESKLQLLC